ncbi:MAG: nucleoside kinase [Lachnospiraceae bacterium]|nr:nucleoside kinase [Lachnospiraceae bacterium]
MDKLSITFEGKTYNVEKGMSIKEFIDEYVKDVNHEYLLAFVDNKLCELSKKLKRNGKLELVSRNSIMGFDTYRRSLTLLMVKAFADVLETKRDYAVHVMYSMGTGYYCKLLNKKEEVKLEKPGDELIAKVKQRMLDIVSEDMRIYKMSISVEDAITRFEKQGRLDKANLFRYRRASRVNIYNLDGYEDYFYGYMVYSAGYLTCFDLFTYDEGFILMAPDKKDYTVIPEFKPQKKLFEVLKTSDDWGRMLDVDSVGQLNNSITTGDIKELMLAQEALQEKQIADIAEMIKNDGRKIVLIAGPSSSGKTTFSHRLSVQLRAHGLRPYPLELDNYFVDRDFTPRDEDGNYDFECIEAMDLNLFNTDVKRLLNGEEIEIPTFNFTIGVKEYKGKRLKLNKGDVLVAEGIHALNPLMTKEIPDESKFRIYISALTQINIDEHNRIPTTDGRLIRRIVRDARTRGNDAQKTISMWPSVRRGEEKYIFPFQEEADVMFNSALIHELSVIKQFAEPLLFAVPRDSFEYYEAKRLLKFLDYFVGLDTTDIPKNSILREFVGGGCFGHN